MAVSNWTYWMRSLLRPRVIRNGNVWLDLGELALTRQAKGLYADRHEQAEREIVAAHLRPEDTVLELGAGMGLVTIACCQIVGSDRVQTLEANPRMEAVLRRNFELNGVQPQLRMAMVAAEEGVETFHVSDRFLVSSRYAEATRVSRAAVTATAVPTIPLSRLLAEVQPTFLIADIEGGELELLNPAVDLASVQRICVEVHPQIIGDEQAGRLIEHLLGQGFYLSLQSSRGIVLYFERRATERGQLRLVS